MQESAGRLGPWASLGKLRGCEEGGGGGLGRGEVGVMGQERLAAGSRAPLSDGGRAVGGRDRVGGVSRPGLDPVWLESWPECQAGAEEQSGKGVGVSGSRWWGRGKG